MGAGRHELRHARRFVRGNRNEATGSTETLPQSADAASDLSGHVVTPGHGRGHLATEDVPLLVERHNTEACRSLDGP
jgi:hypothetical protein